MPGLNCGNWGTFNQWLGGYLLQQMLQVLNHHLRLNRRCILTLFRDSFAMTRDDIEAPLMGYEDGDSFFGLSPLSLAWRFIHSFSFLLGGTTFIAGKHIINLIISLSPHQLVISI